MQKLEGTPVDLSQSIPGFTELKADIQELLNGIARNTVEVVIEMILIEQDVVNAPLHKGSAASILAGKLARRIIRATQQGASEDQIVSSITQGFSHAGVE